MTGSKYVSSYDPNAKLPGIGSIWVWEIDACPELIEVTEVFWNGEEWWVRTRPWNARTIVPLEQTNLNDVGRFWEAVTPVRQTRTPRPKLEPPEWMNP